VSYPRHAEPLAQGNGLPNEPLHPGSGLDADVTGIGHDSLTCAPPSQIVAKPQSTRVKCDSVCLRAVLATINGRIRCGKPGCQTVVM
jgi:hypothetical protein